MSRREKLNDFLIQATTEKNLDEISSLRAEISELRLNYYEVVGQRNDFISENAKLKELVREAMTGQYDTQKDWLARAKELVGE